MGEATERLDPTPRTRDQMVEVRFGVETRALDAETVVVSVHGDVDLVTAGELGGELLGAAASGARRVLVDVTESTLFGSSAIHVLVRSVERLQSCGLLVGVVCANPTAAKVFRITGVDQDLRIFTTVEQARSLASVRDRLRPGLPRLDPAAEGTYA